MNIRAVKLLSLGALITFVLVAPAVAAQDDGSGGYGSNYGTMHGPGMMGVAPAWMPSLTNDQRDEIGKLREDLHKQRWQNMGRIMERRKKLLELYSVESPDAKRIGAVYGEIFNLLRQMIEVSIDVRNRTLAVLTEEQRAQLDQWRRGWGARYGGPGMMAPGMMAPGMMAPGMMAPGMMTPGMMAPGMMGQ